MELVVYHKIRKYHFWAVGVITLIMLVTSYISYQLLEQQKFDIHNVHLASSQRVLCQQMALYADQIRYHPKYNVSFSRDKLKSTAIEFLNNHKLLTSVKYNPYVSQEAYEIYAANKGQLDKQLIAFAENGLKLSDTNDTSHWQYTHSDIDQLLSGLERLVLQFERDASTRVTKAVEKELTLLFSGLSVLLLVYLFLLRPVKKYIVPPKKA